MAVMMSSSVSFSGRQDDRKRERETEPAPLVPFECYFVLAKFLEESQRPPIEAICREVRVTTGVPGCALGRPGSACVRGRYVVHLLQDASFETSQPNHTTGTINQTSFILRSQKANSHATKPPHQL
eukprot:1327705-Amphidinium_carterae.1